MRDGIVWTLDPLCGHEWDLEVHCPIRVGLLLSLDKCRHNCFVITTFPVVSDLQEGGLSKGIGRQRGR
jgi:hypothetical protein